MIRILLSWALQFLLLTAVGSLCLRIGLSKLGIFPQRLNIFQRFWVGLCMVLLVLQLWHLAAPINGICFGAMVGLGLAGTPFLFSYFKAITWPARSTIVCGIAIIVLVSLVASWDLAAVFNRHIQDDTELYHFNIVRWYNEYPVVPGLANLHNRLGFNSAYLLYASLWDNFTWDQRSAWITAGFFEIVALAQWISIILSGRKYPLVARVFCVFSLPCLFAPLDRLGPSLYYDLLSQTVVMVLAVEILSLRAFSMTRSQLSPQDSEENRTEIFERAPYFLALAAIGFVAKPIGAMTLFAVTMGLFLAAWKWERTAALGRPWISRWSRRFLMPTLLVAGYMLRNIFLSGWLFYPAPVLDLGIPWALPSEQLNELYAVIKSFARVPQDRLNGLTMTFWEWFPVWRKGFDRSLEKELLTLGTGLWLAFFIATRHRRKDSRFPIEVFLFVLCVANLLFWLSVAPDLRFGHAFCWMFTSLGFSFAAIHFLSISRVTLFVALGASLYFAGSMRMEGIPSKPTYLWKLGQAKPNKLEQVTVQNGQTPPLVVWIPAPNEAGPGDSPLPSTNLRPPDSLQWRVPGNLRWGFQQTQKSGSTPPPE